MLDFYIVARGGVPFGAIQPTPPDKMAVKPEKYLKKMGSAANLMCLEIGAGAGDVDNPIRAVADFVGATNIHLFPRAENRPSSTSEQ